MSGGKHLLFEGNSIGLLDDLRFPAQAINPPGAPSDPSRSQTTGFLLFITSSDQMIAGVAQLPHTWLEGSIIYPHLHLRATTTDPGAGPANVAVFRLEYKWYNLDDPTPASYTSETINITLPPHSGTAVNIKNYFSGIDGTGLEISSLFEWRITRLGLTAGATDSYPDYCELVEFDIHYYRNKIGKNVTVP